MNNVPEETADWQWIDLEALPSPLFPPLEYYFANLETGNTFLTQNLYLIDGRTARTLADIRGHKIMKLSLKGSLGAVLVMSMVLSGGAVKAANGTCQNVAIPVGLSEGAPLNQTISGTLCQPTEWAAGPHQVDVLVHGATYNRQYWDWPVNPPIYSYVRDTLQAGRATFAYDRLGAGQSSRPLGTSVNMATDAFALHQVVTWNHNQGFAEVNLVGHSLGSFVAIDEAGKYPDEINRLVVTGLLHAVGPGVADFFASVLPLPLEPTYLTTRPGTRGNLFYNDTANPGVIAYDETHKDVVPSGELSDPDFFMSLAIPSGEGLHIKAPVLVMVGQDDRLVCGLAVDCNDPSAVQSHETPFYPAAESLTTEVVPNTGHDLALHPSAPASFTSINSWIMSH